MPVMNGRGSVGAGVGGGRVSIDNVPIAVGGCAQWLDDDTLIFNGPNASGTWMLRTYYVPMRTLSDLDGRGANRLAAGGGRYAAVAAALYANFPFDSGSSMLTKGDERGAASPDGCVCLCSSPSCDDVVAYWPDGTVERIASGPPYGLEVIAKGQYMWDAGCHPVGSIVTASPMIDKRAAVMDDGLWISGWLDGTGLVVQPNGAAAGYVLSTTPAYNHRIRNVGGALMACWSRTNGEGPGDQVAVTVDRTQPRVPLAPPPSPVVVPPVDKPCVLAWYSDEATPAPENCALRVAFNSTEVADNLLRYADNRAFAQLIDVETSLSDMAAAITAARARYPSLPVVVYWPPGFWGQHVDADYYAVEAYWKVGESAQAFHDRVSAEMARHAHAWVTAQAYTSNAGNTPNVADVVPIVANLIREHGNCDGCLPFSAGTRLGGWNDLDARTQQAWRDLFDSITGVPTIPPIVPPIPPIPPPHEFPLFQGVTIMDPINVALVGPNGLYASVDPTSKALTFDRTDAQAWETWTLAPAPGDARGRYTLAPQSAPDHVLGIDTTQYGSDQLHKLYYVKTGAPGNYELFDVRSDSVTGYDFASIIYVDQGVRTKPFFSPGVTVVKL
jgi:hypothetical protein